MAGYQDKFTSKLAGPDVARAQMALQQRMPSSNVGFKPASVFGANEKPFYSNNPYSAGNSIRPKGFSASQASLDPGWSPSVNLSNSQVLGFDQALMQDQPDQSMFDSGMGSVPSSPWDSLLEGWGGQIEQPDNNLFRQIGGFGQQSWQSESGSQPLGQWWNPYAAPEQSPGGGYGGTGTAVYKPGFGQFTPDVIPEINAAAAKYGVPANFLYTIIAKESSGNWDRNNFLSNIRPGSGPLMPYIGVFKNAADSWGAGPLWDQAIGNRAKQIEILAIVLRGQYDKLKGQNPAYNWLNVANYHFSGRPVPVGWNDELGNNDNVYFNQTKEWWGMLEPGFNPDGGITGSGGSSGIGTGVSGIMGGNNYRHSQEFGRTAWSTGDGAWMYDYGAGLGVPSGHPGIDYSMPSGTPLYLPGSGTVIRAGGSGSFADYRGDGPGRGELRIQLDNGDLVIFGHMSSIPWQVGQRVSAGQLAGYSGSYNGDHLHLEVRRPGNTSTGWMAVNPEEYFGGMSVAYGGGGPAQQQQSSASTAPWWVTMWS